MGCVGRTRSRGKVVAILRHLPHVRRSRIAQGLRFGRTSACLCRLDCMDMSEADSFMRIVEWINRNADCEYLKTTRLEGSHPALILLT
jgi:hypothetical protein